jgi:DNA-binding NtrC family response regulator
MDAKWTALIIDADPAIRQSIRLCLEAETARVHYVETKQRALGLLERSGFDVVVLDLWLVADSGLSMIPEILRRQPNEGIIGVTAYANHLLHFFKRRQGWNNLEFSTLSKSAIQSHTWPSNLRELSNAVERAVILCPGYSD